MASPQRDPALLPATDARRILAALLGVILAGTLGYRWIEGVPWLDALYMTVITITTIGYGEVFPLSTAGRVFTILLSLAGVFVLFFMAGVVLARALFENLPRLRRRRMQREIDRLQDHVILCGSGRLGEIVLQELRRAGRPFVVLEKDPDRCRALQEEGILALAGDATDEELLRRAGIERASGVIAAVHTDADNMYIALTARQLNPRCRIIARAEDEQSAAKLQRVGADQVVTPYLLGGRRLAHALLRPSVVDLADLALGGPDSEVLLEELELPPGTPEDTTLAGLEVGSRFGLVAVGLRPAGECRLRFQVGARDPLKAGDRLLVLGPRTALDRFEAFLAEQSRASA